MVLDREGAERCGIAHSALGAQCAGLQFQGHEGAAGVGRAQAARRLGGKSEALIEGGIADHDDGGEAAGGAGPDPGLGQRAADALALMLGPHRQGARAAASVTRPLAPSIGRRLNRIWPPGSPRAPTATSETRASPSARSWSIRSASARCPNACATMSRIWGISPGCSTRMTGGLFICDSWLTWRGGGCSHINQVETNAKALRVLGALS